jgi:ribonuclease BN (tRNA processing enzyme)
MTGTEVQAQIAAALVAASNAGARFSGVEEAQAWLVENLPFHQRSFYGGDTTCMLVRCGSNMLIIDAGTGIRRLGKELMPSLFQNKKGTLHILFTHMHMDHIMGFPFFSPLFLPKHKVPVKLILHGGARWSTDLETVLTSTLSPPVFPLSLDQINSEAASIEYQSIGEGVPMVLGEEDEIQISCRRLHHPNETYGFRVEYGGRVFVCATDTEPYAGPDLGLAELAHQADLLYVDSQYDWNQYIGQHDRVPRTGWGHGYAEWCGKYAKEAKVKMAVMGHHDPGATNQRVFDIGEKMRQEFPNTVIGFDGLRVSISKDEIVAVGAGEKGQDARVLRG